MVVREGRRVALEGDGEARLVQVPQAQGRTRLRNALSPRALRTVCNTHTQTLTISAFSFPPSNVVGRQARAQIHTDRDREQYQIPRCRASQRGALPRPPWTTPGRSSSTCRLTPVPSDSTSSGMIKLAPSSSRVSEESMVSGEPKRSSLFQVRCVRGLTGTFSHSSPPTVQTGYPSSVPSTTPRRTSPHLTLPIPFPHLTTLAPVSTSTPAFAPAP